jgi:hypothetical protein
MWENFIRHAGRPGVPTRKDACRHKRRPLPKPRETQTTIGFEILTAEFFALLMLALVIAGCAGTLAVGICRRCSGPFPAGITNVLSSFPRERIILTPQFEIPDRIQPHGFAAGSG